MSYHGAEARRRERARARSARLRRGRVAAVGSLLGVVVVIVLLVAASSSGTGRSSGRLRSAGARRRSQARGHRTASRRGSGTPGHDTAPILVYHVINPPIPDAPYPELYVPTPEFAAQMQALKSAGWHAVTLNQLEANWRRGVSLGPGKPIVLSFDNGYQSQYTNALPVLRRLGWVGVENLQLTGLPPSQGGLSESQVRGLVAAGWELDTQGISHADLVTLGTAQLRDQVLSARQTLRHRYGVPVDWFCYPSGDYDSTVIGAVRSAGYLGATTEEPGWASRSDDPYRLPRLRVLGGTSPSQLLAEIAAAEHTSPPPPSYS
jgi:peptidoglycan/xylan/chitin deacetylase (PgdA/CDA1 family)